MHSFALAAFSTILIQVTGAPLAIVPRSAVLATRLPVKRSSVYAPQSSQVVTQPKPCGDPPAPPKYDNFSMGIPGTIEVLVQTSSFTSFLSNSSASALNTTVQSVGSLVVAQNRDVSNSSFVLDVSNATVPAHFLIHPEFSAPTIDSQPDWTTISLRMSNNCSVYNNTSSSPMCAEFNSGIISSAPIVVKPCMTNYDLSSSASQLFVFDTVTSRIMPFWASLLNATHSTNLATGLTNAPVNYATQPQSLTAQPLPAHFIFKQSSSLPLLPRAFFATDDEDPPADPVDDAGDTSDVGGASDAGDSGGPVVPSFYADNQAQATQLQQSFANLTPDSSCNHGDIACIGDQFAHCNWGSWVVMSCGPGTVCRVLPLWLQPGISTTCDTAADANLRMSIGTTQTS